MHVTARGLHTMPKTSVTVGMGAVHEEAAHEHGHGESKTGFSVHFMKLNDVGTETETNLTAHVENENRPLEKAHVRYEIWNNSNAEKHE
ncbi:hypothetical protein [Domibacillus mangrovi]|nr:hypothetical protein [Domibacillus mangrovi]